MQNLLGNDSTRSINEILANKESTIKIKIFSRKGNKKQKNSFTSLMQKENEKSQFKPEINDNVKEIITNSFQVNEINTDFIEKPTDNIILSRKTLPSTCLSKVSNYDELILTSSTLYSQNLNNTSSDISFVSNSNISIIFPDVEYSPVPEKEYYDDILQELLLEEKNLTKYKECSYINYHPGLDNYERAKMVFFIYKMANSFKLKIRTIFLSVQTIDRFFCKEKIDQYYFPLLCMCVLVVSSKFNEIYYPAYKDIILFFGKGYEYTVEQALKMEALVLKTIDYNLIPNFPMCFFDIIAQKTNLTEMEYYLGNLMLELIQFDFFFYPIKNSILAQTVFGNVVSLTRGKDYDALKVLKGIFQEENFDKNSDNLLLMNKISNVLIHLLQNLKCNYFVEIYEKYKRPEILGDSINYFLKE